MMLRQLFDFNVIASNPSLDAMIEETMGRYGSRGRNELDDEDLEWVNAAGSDALRAHLDDLDNN